MICTTCGKENAADQSYCTGCGMPLDQKTCANGHAIPEGLKECPFCPSNAAPRPQTVQEPRGRKTRIATEEEMKMERDRVPSTSSGRGEQGTIWRPPDEQKPGVAARASAQQATLIGFLVSFTTSASGSYWPLRFGRTALGRRAGSEVHLDYPDVSMDHAVITARQGRSGLRIWVEDRSTNGTELNGEDIFNERPSLSHGDRIKLGAVELKLLLID